MSVRPNRSAPKDALQRQWVDASSLQFRLTAGITATLLGGLGSLFVWMFWETDRTLMTQHRHELETVVNQIPTQLKNLSRSEAQPAQVQALVNRLTASNTWLWVRQTNGTVLAQSIGLRQFSERDELLRLTQVSSEPVVTTMDGHHILWCTYPLQVEGKLVGQIYVAEDVTESYAMLTTLSRNLKIAAAFSLTLMSLIVAGLIWRSLHPLRQVNRFAETYSSNNPTLARIDPEQLPTEVRELAYTYNRLLDRLLQTAQQQRQFTQDVSHELRTPLSLVYGYLQSTLKRCPNLTEMQQEALSIAASETEHTIQLLQGLLELARTESSDLLLRSERLSINEVVVSVAQMTQKCEQCSIVLDSQPEPVMAIADREQLMRVLMHLIDNAIQYSAPGQPITVKVRQETPWAVIQVCDRGCGIPEAEQSMIFASFHRVDPSRSRATGGVGLGLAIVKSLVEGMGGEISLKSNLGHGSTFTVKLPLASAIPTPTPNS